MAKEDDGYIRFQCKQCGQRLKIRSDREGGGVMQCPRCGASVNIPMANIQEIAKGAEMAETGQPGRLNVNPDLLMKRLRGEDGKKTGPGSRGGAPTLRDGPWNASAAFSRDVHLDQLVAALTKIDQEVLGQIQKLYRERGLGPEERALQFEVIGDRRRNEIRDLLSNRLFILQQEIRTMEAQRDRLMRSDLERLEALKLAHQALTLYGQHVLGVQV